MLKLVILFAAISCALGAAVPEGMLPLPDGRIVGGIETTISDFPWQISLQRNGGHSCGGSVYSEQYVITAAHCLQNGVSAKVLNVRAGSTYWKTGGTNVKVSEYYNHEGYKGNTHINDISIVKLESFLKFSSRIRAIPLATVSPPNGAHAMVSGWGTESSGAKDIPDKLLYIDVEIVSKSVCGSKDYSYGSRIKDTMICAAATDKDACQGDSGGPLVSDGKLVGVVSWGIGCARAKYPGVYADVADLRSWVIDSVDSLKGY